ncbi:MAG: hypothetical protein FWC51_03490 [Proteobacteria bacterium]|nr:hypothetical protein [Pseudomonadota bacterium]
MAAPQQIVLIPENSEHRNLPLEFVKTITPGKPESYSLYSKVNGVRGPVITTGATHPYQIMGDQNGWVVIKRFGAGHPALLMINATTGELYANMPKFGAEEIAVQKVGKSIYIRPFKDGKRTEGADYFWHFQKGRTDELPMSRPTAGMAEFYNDDIGIRVDQPAPTPEPVQKPTKEKAQKAPKETKSAEQKSEELKAKWRGKELAYLRVMRTTLASQIKNGTRKSGIPPELDLIIAEKEKEKESEQTRDATVKSEALKKKWRGKELPELRIIRSGIKSRFNAGKRKSPDCPELDEIIAEKEEEQRLIDVENGKVPKKRKQQTFGVGAAIPPPAEITAEQVFEYIRQHPAILKHPEVIALITHNATDSAAVESGAPPTVTNKRTPEQKRKYTKHDGVRYGKRAKTVAVLENSQLNIDFSKLIVPETPITEIPAEIKTEPVSTTEPVAPVPAGPKEISVEITYNKIKINGTTYYKNTEIIENVRTLFGGTLFDVKYKDPNNLGKSTHNIYQSKDFETDSGKKVAPLNYKNMGPISNAVPNAADDTVTLNFHARRKPEYLYAYKQNKNIVFVIKGEAAGIFAVR